MSNQSLFYRELGSGEPLIILHGVFGSSDNWMSVARDLESDFKLYVLDQRNHGNSFHSDEFDYASMVRDLDKFIDEHKVDNPIVLGHSMGGKVAMNFAIQHPDKLKNLIIVDIAPRSYPIHHHEILEGLSSIDLDLLESRYDADQQLAKFVSERPIRNFLLKNLSRNDEGKFEWKLNLPIIRMNIERVGIGLPGNEKFEKETLFIKGSRSNYIDDGDVAMISERFPKAKIEVIEDAGHWVHAEKQKKFLDVLRAYLRA